MALLKKPPVEAPLATEARSQPRTGPDLIVALGSDDATARRWAARDLAGHPGASEALLHRLAQEEDPSVRQVIFTTLAKLRDPIAVAGLVSCLRSEVPALRNEAVEIMQGLPAEVAPLMEGLLADPDPDVRILAVNILESLRHPLVETWLIRVIETDPHINVCGSALDLLSEVGSPQAVAAIGHLKERFADQPYIQFTADLALARIGRA